MNTLHLSALFLAVTVFCPTPQSLGGTVDYVGETLFLESATKDVWHTWQSTSSPNEDDIGAIFLAPNVVESTFDDFLEVEEATTAQQTVDIVAQVRAESQAIQDAIDSVQNTVLAGIAALRHSSEIQPTDAGVPLNWKNFWCSEFFWSLMILTLTVGIVAYASRSDRATSSDRSEGKYVSGNNSGTDPSLDPANGPSSLPRSRMQYSQDSLQQAPVAGLVAGARGVLSTDSEVAIAAKCATSRIPAALQQLDSHAETNDIHALPSPDTAIERLLTSMEASPVIRKLHKGQAEWEAGFARNIGPVRSEQQDYLFTFAVGDLLCGVLADGCGGHPYGATASYVGAIGATASLCDYLAFWNEDDEIPLEKIARKSVEDASLTISAHATAHGISKEHSLRSTIIVVIADQEQFAWAYLGDGGGWVLKSSPITATSFLTPDKGETSNELLSSLGPDIRGSISSGTRLWEDADLLCLASDGIADVVDHSSFAKACINASLKEDGDLRRAANTVLDRLLESPDVTDNVSLALIGRGFKPCLASPQTSKTYQDQA